MNWQEITISRKITIGFGIVLLLFVVGSFIGYKGINSIVGNAGEVIKGNELNNILSQREVDHLNWVNKVNLLLTDDRVTTLDVETDDHKCGFGKWLFGEGRKDAEKMAPLLAPLFKKIEEPHLRLHESAIDIGRHYQQADMELGNFLREKKIDHLWWINKIEDAFLDPSITEIKAESDPGKCDLGKWMYSPQTIKLKNSDPEFAALFNDLEVFHSGAHESVITIQGLVDENKRDEALDHYHRITAPLTEKGLSQIDKMIKWHEEKMHGMQMAKKIYAERTIPALVEIQGILHQIGEEAEKHIMTDKAMLDSAKNTQRSVIIFSIFAIVTGVLFAFFISRGIITVLKRITGQIGQGAEQVAAASTQVASASQQLAEGSSEQAASLEETSSSLEEMSSMTSRNADNAGQANTLMSEANKTVKEANDSMNELTVSMVDITKASEETSKIIKTIDEIAFQTNLLALNAAVEAARAGEAGAGFAVVADEVRNLAMRAAEAAKNTADLIEGTVKKVGDGSELVSRTNEAFALVAESSQKIAELISEISLASKEQAEGIEQISKAITQMDTVVQQNAANAEESASASEELNGQAEQMKIAVEELEMLIMGMKKAGHLHMHQTAGTRRSDGASTLWENKPDHAKTAGNKYPPMETDRKFSDF